MATAPKSLVISLKADVREGQKLQKFIQDAIAGSNRLAKSMSTLTTGGQAGVGAQRGAFAKVIQGDTKALAALGKTGETLGRVLKNQVGREVEDLGKKIAQTTTNLEKLTSKAAAAQAELENLEAGGAAPGDIAAARKRASTLANRAARRVQHKQAMEGAVADLTAEDKGPGMMDGLGGMARALGLPVGTAVLMSMAISNIRSLALGGGRRDMEKSMVGYQAAAMSGQAFGGMAAGTMQGDLGYAMAHQRLRANPGQFNKALEAAMPGIKSMRNERAIQMGSLWDLPEAMHKWGIANQMADAQVKERYRGVYDSDRAAHPVEEAAVQFAQGVAGSRVGANRRYGSGQAERWADIGYKNVVDPSEVTSALGGIIDQSGRAAGGQLEQRAIRAIVNGMSSGAVAQAGAATMFGGGDLLGKVLGKGFQGAMADAVASMAGGVAMGGDGRWSSDLGMGAFTKGMDLLDVQRMQGGFNALGAIGGGQQSPFQATLNMVSAVANGGRGGVYGQQALGRMNQQEMLAALRGEAPNDRLAAYGYDAKTLQKQMQDSLNGSLNQFYDDPTAQGPGVELMRKAKQSGNLIGTIRQTKDDKLLRQMASVYGESMGLSMNDAEAMFRAIRDGGTAGPSGDGEDRAGGTSKEMERARLAGQSNLDQKTRDPNSGLGKEAINAAKNAQSFANVMGSMADINITAGEAAVSLSKLDMTAASLAATFERLTNSIGGSKTDKVEQQRIQRAVAKQVKEANDHAYRLAGGQ